MRRYWPGFEWQVAWRFLREGRMQTLLIIVGVAAGVAVVAYISALIEGLQANTLAKTLGAQAHISLRAPEDLVAPAARLEAGTAVLSDTQPRAQRLRSVATWQALLAIPYGHTRSYAEQARGIGKPTATRAVAAANGSNKVSLIVPCHRVIGSDGSLTGYGGGMPRKQWLLALERGERELAPPDPRA